MMHIMSISIGYAHVVGLCNQNKDYVFACFSYETFSFHVYLFFFLPWVVVSYLHVWDTC